MHTSISLRKSFINDTNKRKCLSFAQKYVNMPVSFWKNVVWSDESKFELFGKKKKSDDRFEREQRIDVLFKREYFVRILNHKLATIRF